MLCSLSIQCVYKRVPIKTEQPDLISFFCILHTQRLSCQKIPDEIILTHQQQQIQRGYFQGGDVASSVLSFTLDTVGFNSAQLDKIVADLNAYDNVIAQGQGDSIEVLLDSDYAYVATVA